MPALRPAPTIALDGSLPRQPSRQQTIRLLQSAFPSRLGSVSAVTHCAASVADPSASPALSGDSPSLWNTSINQGWSAHQEDVLCKALLKFGVGNWRALLDSGCLPGKNPAQCYLQTQRILGQQSISEFTGLHLDIRAVGECNKKRVDVVRKNGLIWNVGGKLSRPELLKKMQQNRERYEVAEEVWRAVELPQRDSVTQRIAEKKVYLGMLEAELAQVRERMKAVKAAMAAEASSLAAPTNRTAPTSERDPARQQPPHLPAAIPSDFMLPTSGSTQDHVNNTNIDLDAAINAYGASGGGSGGLGNGLWTIMEVLVILHTLPIVYWIWTLYRHRGVKDAEYVKKTDIKNLRELKRLAR